jgi:acetoacetyl-CoA synthetase
VITGEIQCKGLGMSIEAWDPSGKRVPDGEEGDLVCTKPFPCQPVTFWSSDPAATPQSSNISPTDTLSAGDVKYRAAYFETFPGVWHHGDFVRFEPDSNGQGLTMLGRSDGVLKPNGVRFGSAEIYNILLKHFSVQVDDAVCVGRRRESDTDETVVLFLKMASGKEFTASLEGEIKAVIRKELSARHVPGIIDECFEIPVTGNGKKYVHSISSCFVFSA